MTVSSRSAPSRFDLGHGVNSNFDAADWEIRFSDALKALTKTQESFLQDYWNVNGYPTRYTYKGKDETPWGRVKQQIADTSTNTIAKSPI